MSQEVNQLAQVITCHAYNAKRDKVAICPNNNEIHVYTKSSDGWNLESVLKEHDQTVMGLDLGSKTNRIVSCSQDRNAYVWNQGSDGKWKPTLVILRINRAATDVKWSPLENKFAVATGSKLVSICYFEEDHDWWLSKHIKKHRSTVLTVAWHPNNILIATGSTDFKTRIFGAYIKGVDKGNKSEVYSAKPIGFGEVLAEFDSQGWVHAVAFTPGGKVLAWTGHDSRVTFADISGAEPAVETVKLSGLPVTCITFISDTTLIGAGHECNPIIFENKGGWKEGARLDKAEAAAAPKNTSAADKFKSLEKVGQEKNVTALNTKHQNYIKNVVPFAGNAGSVNQVSTSGVDGRIVLWKV